MCVVLVTSSRINAQKSKSAVRRRLIMATVTLTALGLLWGETYAVYLRS